MKKVLPSAVACSWNCSTMPSGDCARKPVEYGRATRRWLLVNVPTICHKLRYGSKCSAIVVVSYPPGFPPLFFLHKRERQRERNMH